MNYVKINDVLYPATIFGRMQDKNWNDRESKAITLEMDYATAVSIFVDGLAWAIVHQPEEGDAQEYDNSDFYVAGSITDNRNGTITVKMGKKTDGEMLNELMGVLNNA
jgi:hypothetical protein